MSSGTKVTREVGAEVAHRLLEVLRLRLNTFIDDMDDMS